MGHPSGPESPALVTVGEHGEVTASTLPQDLQFYASLFLTCPHERSVAPDRRGLGVCGGCNSNRRLTLMTSWVIGTVPGLRGTVTSPWAGGRDEHLQMPGGAELCKELVGVQRAREGARVGTGAGGGDVAPRNPQPEPRQHPAPAGSVPSCSQPAPASAPPFACKRGRIKDELLAQPRRPPGTSTLPLLPDFPAPMTQLPFSLTKRSQALAAWPRF